MSACTFLDVEAETSNAVGMDTWTSRMVTRTVERVAFSIMLVMVFSKQYCWSSAYWKLTGLVIFWHL